MFQQGFIHRAGRLCHCVHFANEWPAADLKPLALERLSDAYKEKGLQNVKFLEIPTYM